MHQHPFSNETTLFVNVILSNWPVMYAVFNPPFTFPEGHLYDIYKIDNLTF